MSNPKQPRLDIRDLRVAVEDKIILNGIDLTIHPGKVHAIMGPNGSGKSTLAMALMGHPKYQIVGGEVRFDGNDLLALKPHERAMYGLFAAFQYPQEIEGVPLVRFLWSAVSTRRKAGFDSGFPRDLLAFGRELRSYLETVKLDPNFSQRHLNIGFSGGEKKRAEVVQMLTLKPRLAILDEIDSGLDIDNVKIVAEAIQAARTEDMSILIITHFPRILHYLEPDFVHVMVDGRIVHTGDIKLALELEASGYETFLQKIIPYPSAPRSKPSIN